MSRILKIENCEQCHRCVTERVYVADSFDDIRKVYCKCLGKYIHNYLDRRDKSVIPDECPLDNK